MNASSISIVEKLDHKSLNRLKHLTIQISPHYFPYNNAKLYLFYKNKIINHLS